MAAGAGSVAKWWILLPDKKPQQCNLVLIEPVLTSSYMDPTFRHVKLA